MKHFGTIQTGDGCKGVMGSDCKGVSTSGDGYFGIITTGEECKGVLQPGD